MMSSLPESNSVLFRLTTVPSLGWHWYHPCNDNCIFWSWQPSYSSGWQHCLLAWYPEDISTVARLLLAAGPYPRKGFIRDYSAVSRSRESRPRLRGWEEAVTINGDNNIMDMALEPCVGCAIMQTRRYLRRAQCVVRRAIKMLHGTSRDSEIVLRVKRLCDSYKMATLRFMF